MKPNQRSTSFRFATTMSNINIVKPTYSALNRNFSLGARPVTISYMRKSTWPPSSAGIGSMFMNARMMLRNAVILQNSIQSQTGGKRLPMAPNPPSDFAPSAVNTYFMSSTYPRNTPIPYLIPAGKLSRNPYSVVTGL